MLFVKVNLNQANHVNLFLELYSDFIFFFLLVAVLMTGVTRSFSFIYKQQSVMH